MTLSITYQELQQLVADKLHKNIELHYADIQVIKLTLHTAIKKIVTINVDLSAELKLSVYGTDLYIDYNIMPIDNVIGGRLTGIIDSVAPNVIDSVMNHFKSKYPQYKDVVEQVPDANRLRVHLNAIPRLSNILQHIEIESIIPQENGLQIIAHMKNK